MSLARGLYSTALTLLSPLIWQRVWREHDAEHSRAERLGIIPATPDDTADGERPIWLHAASLGEVVTVAGLIESLRRRYPKRILVVTTMTATGAAQATRLLHTPKGSSELSAARHHYLPLDFPLSAERFIARLRPALAVLVETELWPNLMAACTRHDVPLAVVNGRLSARAFARYRKVSGVMRDSLARIEWLGAKAEEDLARFVELGLPAERGEVTGSLKFELEVSLQVTSDGLALKSRFAQEHSTPRPVWIAASTHEGEDEPLLAAHARVRETHPEALLLLVPRHPQRFEAVAALGERWAKARGEQVMRRSQMRDDSVLDAASLSVLVGDSLGELLTLYAASDIAFVGGSLVPIGGHNLLEPAALGLPLLSGPSLDNFREIADVMTDEGALQVMAEPESLANAVTTLMSDAVHRERAGAAARQLVERNRGARKLNLEGLSRLLPV